MDETTVRPATGTDAVALGVAWLDREAPGWRAQVDLSPDAFDMVDMDDPYNCVLAQVSRGQGWYDEAQENEASTPYGAGLSRAIGGDPYDSYSERGDWTRDHGFLANWEATDNGDDTWSSEGLTAGWRAALAA
jgi:hypothetical protein